MMQDCQPGWKPGMPCSQKATKQLGSKSDLETKKLLKFLGMGVGIAGGCVVVWLAFRVSSIKPAICIEEFFAKIVIFDFKV